MILYRPMDIEELRLVYEGGMKGFPPRKPEQPIFYPVLNLEYANEIAKKWNAESQSASGYVARFILDDAYGTRFALDRHKLLSFGLFRAFPAFSASALATGVMVMEAMKAPWTTALA